ncbi:MAG: allophanate hydrolase [Polyangiales bacterium]
MTDPLDVASLHAAYRAGTLTPDALIDALYARMDADALPNVFIHRVAREAAIAQARALGPLHDDDDRRLYGVPFAVKDNIDVEGMPTTAACPAFGFVPHASASAVRALLDQGAVCIGKLNMDQFATGLVGTRSPYGACRNVFDPAYLSGGSSSGSGVAVAAHHVTFALGTDTAGSGRVPAALNNVVGLKPSLGLLPTTGMLPACESLDCLSVFALNVDDAALVRDVILGRAVASTPPPARFRFGVPEPLEGDASTRTLFERSAERLEALGGERVAIDFAPFRALGDLLYGPFVTERHLAVGAFIEANEDAVLPTTRTIILGAREQTASDAFRGIHRAATLKRACLAALAGVDYLLTPTIPAPYTVEADQAEPRAINDKLGIYTRFVNFIGGPVLAVPQDFRDDGLPFGVSLVGRPGHDTRLDALADALHRMSEAGMGRARHPLAPRARAPRPPPIEARLAVVGAHMRDLPLNRELLALDARYVATVRTAAAYRLYVLPGTQPERPGMVRTKDGVGIELELWDLPWSALGTFMARVPSPLGIGTVELADGERVKGFVCESYAVEGARDISALGGYRAYLAQR